MRLKRLTVKSIKVNTLPLCKVDMETGVFFCWPAYLGL